MRLASLSYYLSSIPTLIAGVQNWPALFELAARRPTVVALRRPAIRFHVRSLMDLWIIKETCLDRDYEAMSESLQDGWIILDIGAGLGDFTVYAAYKRPNSCIYAYEPFPESYVLLQENLKLNAVENVQVFPLAVGDGRSAQLALARTGEAVQHSTTAVGSSSAPTLEVPGTTLDQILADNALARCDFMKIDVEGAEYDILFSASDVSLSKIGRVCLEYHDGVTSHSHDELVTFFQNKGYQVKTRPNPVHGHLGLLYAWK